MANFAAAFPTILKHEGGFSNNLSDPGGATKYGVSLRWLKSQDLSVADIDHDGDIDIDDIKNLTPAGAMKFYEEQWWNVYKYGLFNSQAIATKVFDTAINIGPKPAHKIIQAIVEAVPDGILGQQTFNLVNGVAGDIIIIAKYENAQANYYRNLAIAKPALAQFLNGWLNRAYDRV